MKVILFGATGMVGQGVLRECLLDADVESVLTIGRSVTGQADPKVRELAVADLTDYGAVRNELSGYDACLFCLGVSAAGMGDAEYRKITFDITLAAARALLAANPHISFQYISGASTDSSGKGSAMWARVKGETENALLALGFERAFMLRPGLIQPLHGIKSKTRLYRITYTLMTPFYGLLHWLAPMQITTTERLGKAMLRIAKRGAPKQVLEMRDFDALGRD